MKRIHSSDQDIENMTLQSIYLNDILDKIPFSLKSIYKSLKINPPNTVFINNLKLREYFFVLVLYQVEE